MTQLHVWSVLSELGLDPQRSGEDEARFRCPRGCDDGARREKYSGSAHIGQGDRYGAWKCFKCEENGNVRGLGDKDFDPVKVRRREAPPAPPKGQPINMVAAWSALLAVKYQHRARLVDYFLGRGWPAHLAELAADSQDIAWAPEKPIQARDADRLAGHARYAERPLLFAVRDAAGQVQTAIRRTVTGESPKAMTCAKSYCPAEDPWCLGDLRAWAEAAKAGGVVAIVEGEPDFALAQAICKLEGSPIQAVIGAPSANRVFGVARAACAALSRAGAVAPRVILAPHIGDTGPTEKASRAGEKAMQSAAGVLRHGTALVSTLRARPLVRGKADLADVLERAGLDDLLEQLVEVAPIRVGFDGRSWDFGDRIVFSLETVEHTLAEQVWPIGHTRDVEEGDYGLRYLFRTRDGDLEYGVLPASSWGDTGAATAAAREALDAGVQIAPGKGGDWSMAMGQWARWVRCAPIHPVVSRPGWHETREGWIYVNGETVHGARWGWQGPRVRCQRKGSLDDWREGFHDLLDCCGPAGFVAFGTMLAGALVRRMHRPGFIVHLVGNSSAGKSNIAMLASTVWHDPADQLTWDNTAMSVQNDLAIFSGASVVLDDTSKCRNPARDIGQVAHAISHHRGRGRASRSGDNRTRQTFYLLGLSTGEFGGAEALGSEWQGGHAVRMMDVPISSGDCTRDAAHGEAIEAWAPYHYGVAGDEWTRWLQALDEEGWELIEKEAEYFRAALAEQARGAEEGRQARNLSLLGAALLAAARAGLWVHRTPRAQALGVLRWALSSIQVERGEQRTDEERVLGALVELFAVEPARFPLEHEYRKARVEVVGITEEKAKTGHDRTFRSPTGSIWTTEGMLKRSGLFGKIGARRFIKWAIERGVAFRAAAGETSTIGRHKTRWVHLRLDGNTSGEHFAGWG